MGPHGASARLLPVLPSWAAYPAQASQLWGLEFLLHLDGHQATNSTVCVCVCVGGGEGRRGKRPEKGGEEEEVGGGRGRGSGEGRERRCSTIGFPFAQGSAHERANICLHIPDCRIRIATWNAHAFVGAASSVQVTRTKKGLAG